MAKYRITLGDGRDLAVYAASEEIARAQADHQERSRLEIQQWRVGTVATRQGEHDALKEMVDKFGPQIVEQIMRSTKGGEYKLPDFTLPPQLEPNLVTMGVRRKDSPNYDGPISPVVLVTKLKD